MTGKYLQVLGHEVNLFLRSVYLTLTCRIIWLWCVRRVLSTLKAQNKGYTLSYCAEMQRRGEGGWGERKNKKANNIKLFHFVRNLVMASGICTHVGEGCGTCPLRRSFFIEILPKYCWNLFVVVVICHNSQNIHSFVWDNSQPKMSRHKAAQLTMLSLSFNCLSPDSRCAGGQAHILML